MYACMHVCMYVRTYVCMYIHIYIYIYMYVCIYICMYIYNMECMGNVNYLIIITDAWICWVDMCFVFWGFLISNFHHSKLVIFDWGNQWFQWFWGIPKLRNNQHDREWTFRSIYRFNRSSTKQTEEKMDGNFTKNLAIGISLRKAGLLTMRIEHITYKTGTLNYTNQHFTTTKLELEESGKWVRPSQKWQGLPHAPSMNERDHSM